MFRRPGAAGRDRAVPDQKDAVAANGRRLALGACSGRPHELGREPARAAATGALPDGLAAAPMRRSTSAPTIAASSSPSRPISASGSSTRSPASCGSGRGSGHGNRLSEGAIERTIEALRICRGQDGRHGASAAPASSPPRPAARPRTAPPSSPGSQRRARARPRGRRPPHRGLSRRHRLRVARRSARRNR